MADQELDDLALNIEEELRALEAVSTKCFGSPACEQPASSWEPDFSLMAAPDHSIAQAEDESDKLTSYWVCRRAWE